MGQSLCWSCGFRISAILGAGQRWLCSCESRSCFSFLPDIAMQQVSNERNGHPSSHRLTVVDGKDMGCFVHRWLCAAK